jgi:hypothetical protein
VRYKLRVARSGSSPPCLFSCRPPWNRS